MTKKFVYAFDEIADAESYVGGDWDGIKSGVNCTRVKSWDMVSARLLIISVFANPGTPSITTCPRAKNAVRIWPMTSTWPTMIFPTSASINSPDFASLAKASASLPEFGLVDVSILVFPVEVFRGIDFQPVAWFVTVFETGWKPIPLPICAWRILRQRL